MNLKLSRREAIKKGCGAALAAAGFGLECLAGEPAVRAASGPTPSESMKKLEGAVRLLFDEYLRDPSICLGPDGTYYLTGTTSSNDCIRLWKSTNLRQWERLDFEWRYGGSPWHRPYKEKGCPLWAPEVH